MNQKIFIATLDLDKMQSNDLTFEIHYHIGQTIPEAKDKTYVINSVSCGRHPDRGDIAMVVISFD
jgi:hypothetical protein